MKNKKRFASLLLALCMILTLMPVGYANAEQDVPPFEVWVSVDEDGEKHSNNLDSKVTGNETDGYSVEYDEPITSSDDTKSGGLGIVADDGMSVTFTQNDEINVGDNQIGASVYTLGFVEDASATLNLNDNVNGGIGGVYTVVLGNASATVNAEDATITADKDIGTALSVGAGDGGDASVTAGTLESAFGVYADAQDGGMMMLAVSDGDGQPDEEGEGEEEANTTITIAVDEVNATKIAAGLDSKGEGALISMEADTINSDEVGLVLGTAQGGRIEVVADTISTEDTSFIIEEESDLATISVTAWKVENTSGGKLVETANINTPLIGLMMEGEIQYEDGGPIVDDIVKERKYDEKVEKKLINYIIKVEDNPNATLKATKKDGSALEKSHDYDVAHEDEEVYLKVELSAGYQLAGAFSDDGKSVPMSVDANGNYYVKVPKGGGVYLSVKVAKKTANYVEYLPEEAPVQVKVKKVKKAAAEKPAVAMKVVSVSGNKTEYELTINVPAEGFPNGFDLMAVLPHSGLFADTVDQAPTTEGLLDGELCTFTRNGPELSLRFYQEYTDKDNNQPGLKPGARSLKIKFTARRAPDWPEGVERVTTITANAGTAKEKLTLTGEVSVATGAMLNAKWTVTPMESASK